MSALIPPISCPAAPARRAATRRAAAIISTGWSRRSTGPTAPATISPIISAISAETARPISSAAISTRATAPSCRSCISIPRSTTAQSDKGAMKGRVTAILAGKGKDVDRTGVRNRGDRSGDGLPPAAGHVWRLEGPDPRQLQGRAIPRRRMRRRRQRARKDRRELSLANPRPPDADPRGRECRVTAIWKASSWATIPACALSDQA